MCNLFIVCGKVATVHMCSLNNDPGARKDYHTYVDLRKTNLYET